MKFYYLTLNRQTNRPLSPRRLCHFTFHYRRLKLGFHIRGKRKRLAAAASGCGMRYANDLIPYIRLPMRLHSLFLSE